jgi:hypothetical protein
VDDFRQRRAFAGGQFRASTITSRVAMVGIEGRRGLTYRATAWPDVAVVSSLPADSLLLIVHFSHRVEGRVGCPLPISVTGGIRSAVSVCWASASSLTAYPGYLSRPAR